MSLFGFASCEKAPNAMYGVPSATFKVIGTVTNESNLPIEGIRVILNSDTTLTDASGNYLVGVTEFPGDKSLNVTFKDIDGASNGSYIQKDSTVNFVDNEYQNGSGWNSGEVSKTVDIKLKEEL